MRKRTVAWIAAVICAVVIVVTAPLVVAVVHQRRLDSNSSAIARLGRAEQTLKRVQNDLAVSQKKEVADRAQAHYENCLNLLAMWTIDDAVILYETSPGAERNTLLGFLPPQPRCVKP